MDLSKVGNICLIGLIAMIFSQFFFMLFRVSMDVRLWSVIGLLLFTGLTDLGYTKNELYVEWV